LDKRLAFSGAFLVAVAVLVATGAVDPVDRVTSRNTSGEIEITPHGGENADAYVETQDDRISISITRANADSTVVVDNLFDVGYTGEGKAEFWIRDGSSAATFYDSESGLNVEDRESPAEVDENTVPIGVELSTQNRSTLLNGITLVARLPEGANPIDGGNESGGVYVPDPEEESGVDEEPEAEDGGEKRDVDGVVEVDLGGISVSVRQPEFKFDLEVSDTELSIYPDEIAGTATVVDRQEAGPDEMVVAESVVTNTGNEAGSREVGLRVDGEVVGTKTVRLEPGENTTVSFELAFGKPGEYAVTVGDSEPVVVTVSEGAVPAFVAFPAVVVALISLVAAFFILRRLREDEEEDG